MNELALVELKEGKLSTTSLLVAEKFGKEHKNVLRNIEALVESQPEFARLNFEPCSYLADNNRQERMYIMTEEGFAMIAMRFTGKTAEDWQIKFITAFQNLRTQLATPTLHTDSVAEQLAKWDAHCKKFNLPTRHHQAGALQLQGLPLGLLAPTVAPKPPKVPPGVYPNPPKPPKGVDWKWAWVKDPTGDVVLEQKVADWWYHQTLLHHTQEQKLRGKWETYFEEGFLTKLY